MTTFRWRTSESDDTVPYTHHGYAYALSNPILLTDHSGRCSERGQGDDYCHETAAERKAVQDYRWWHPTETCGPPPEEDLFFGEQYTCNERTGRYERILGGTLTVTPSANGIKLVGGAAVLACAAVASWLGLKAAASQPSSIAGNTAPNAPAPTPPPGIDPNHYDDLGTEWRDNGTRGQFRENEADAAARLEQRVGRLERFNPKVHPMDKYGDWIDTHGTTYDAVGPVPQARFFNFEDFTTQITKHLLKQGLDYTVVDVTGLDTTQSTSVTNFINALPPDQIVRIIVLGP